MPRIFIQRGCIVLPFAYNSVAEDALVHLADCVLERRLFFGFRAHHKIVMPDRNPVIVTTRTRKLAPREGRKKAPRIRPSYLIVPAEGLVSDWVLPFEAMGKLPFMQPTAVAEALKRGASLTELEQPMAQVLDWPLYDGYLIFSFAVPKLALVGRRKNTVVLGKP